MARWAAFAGITVAVLVILIVLARTSQTVLTEDGPIDSSDDDQSAHIEDAPVEPRNAGLEPSDARTTGPGAGRSTSSRDLSTRVLLANVAVSQGILWAIVLAGAWYAQIPPAALGIRLGFGPLDTIGLGLVPGLGTPGPLGPLGAIGAIGVVGAIGTQVAVGLGFGLAIAVTNTLGAAAAGSFGFDPSEELRELLAPETPAEWVLLLAVVLPVIAGFEEFLFRAAIVGAFSVGFGVSPWLLAVLSSAVFALGHGAQGTLGVFVTGVLGFVLAAGFVLTGSLLVVVVAHYLVNAVEFVVYEGFGADPLGG